MKAIIIEDEALIAMELQSKIEDLASDIEVLAVLHSIQSAEQWLQNNPEPDLIFADIQLGDGVSFELFERHTMKCPIIFATAYDEYAIRAFKVNGIDYVLKPVDDDELLRAIDKVRLLRNTQAPIVSGLENIMQLIANPALLQSKYKERFVVKHRNAWMPILAKDVAFFYRDQLNYIITHQNEKYILDMNSLDELEEIIDPSLFYRANRQYIINLHAIQSFKTQLNQKLAITLKAPLHKEEIDISRDKAPFFKKWFES